MVKWRLVILFLPQKPKVLYSHSSIHTLLVPTYNHQEEVQGLAQGHCPNTWAHREGTKPSNRRPPNAHVKLEFIKPIFLRNNSDQSAAVKACNLSLLSTFWFCFFIAVKYTWRGKELDLSYRLIEKITVMAAATSREQ